MKITITNGKGGTGKTTLMTVLAEFLYRQNQKVLIIDLDANCSISEIYGKVLQEQTSRLLLTGQTVSPYNVKKSTAGGQLDIVPSELNLSMISNLKDTQLKFELKKLGLESNYDYILIDPPGTWSAMTRNAVNAADTVVVCGKCSPLDFVATQNFLQELAECCLESDVYVVCNAYNKARDPNGIWQKYQEEFTDYLIKEPVPQLNSFQRIVFDNDYKIRADVENRVKGFIDAITGKEWN